MKKAILGVAIIFVLSIGALCITYCKYYKKKKVFTTLGVPIYATLYYDKVEIVQGHTHITLRGDARYMCADKIKWENVEIK